MKTLTCCAVLLLTAASAFADDTTRLWYTRPATEWNQALPVGNGRLGAMVFGGVQEERIQLNEDTVWAGEYRDRVNPQAAAVAGRGAAPADGGARRGGAGARRQDDGVDPEADAAVPDRRRPPAVVPAAGRLHAVRARPRHRHGRCARPLRVGRRHVHARGVLLRGAPGDRDQARERHAREAVVLGHAPPRAGRGDAHGRRRPARDAGLGDPADDQLRPRTPDGRGLPRGDAGGCHRRAHAQRGNARLRGRRGLGRARGGRRHHVARKGPGGRVRTRDRRRHRRPVRQDARRAGPGRLARGARGRLPAPLPPRRASPRRARVATCRPTRGSSA